LTSEIVKPVPPTKGLRAGALLVSCMLNLVGALLVILALPATASDERVAAGWALIQFISGVWAGVLGANSPFLHGLLAGVPALLLGLLVTSPLPPQYVAVSWFLAPSAALLAAALMRYIRRRS